MKPPIEPMVKRRGIYFWFTKMCINGEVIPLDERAVFAAIHAGSGYRRVGPVMFFFRDKAIELVLPQPMRVNVHGQYALPNLLPLRTLPARPAADANALID